MIYYPVPLYKQEAFENYVVKDFELPITEKLCKEVISLPIHTEMNPESMKYVCDQIALFFEN